jgi:hypothetical protein
MFTQSTGTEPLDDLPWSVEVPEGGEARFDPHLIYGSAAAVAGFLLLDGEPAEGWVARLGSDHGFTQVDEVVLDAGGAFRLRARRVGSHLLELGGPDGGRFQRSLELERGELPVSLEVSTGRVSRRDDGEPAPAALFWSGADGWVFRARLRPGEACTAPVGRLRVGGGQDADHVEVQPGQTVEIP